MGYDLGFGKDVAQGRRLHGGNTRNRPRAVLFQVQGPPPSVRLVTDSHPDTPLVKVVD